MDKFALKKMFPSDKIKIVDNSCYVNSADKNNVLVELKKCQVSAQLISFVDEFAGISMLTKMDKHVSKV